MKIIVLLIEKNSPKVFYRILQPYGYLKNVLGKDISIYDLDHPDKEQLGNEVKLADVVVFHEPYTHDQYRLIKAIMGRKDKKQRVVADFDDDPFNVCPWHCSYALLGTKEVGNLHLDRKQVDDLMPSIREDDKQLFQMNPDGSANAYMWKDKHRSFLWGEDGDRFDIAENLARLETIKKIMREVDLITAATPQFAEELRKYRPQGRITILPNLVDFGRFLPMKKKNDGKLRIVWQGPSAHYLDLTMVKQELISFARKHPEVEYVFQGTKLPAIFHEIADRVTWLPWHSDINTYPLSLTELAGDIAICPLTDDAFNYGKSPLKWEEMSAMKVPSVCSPIVYGNFIEHGKTGFIARQGEWGTCLEKLLDPDLRRQIGQNAYDDVKERFSIQNAAMYWAALEDISLL